MDPFSRLPWMALKKIFLELPDLPTLHRLHNASPACADFLHHDSRAVFPEVVDKILSQKSDTGMNWSGATRAEFYLMIQIWRRAQDRAAAKYDSTSHFLGLDEDTSVRQDYESLRGSLLCCERISRPSPVPQIPKATPPNILCRVLSMSSRIRQISHQIFHELISRCMDLKIQHIQEPKPDPWSYRCPSSRDLDPRSLLPPLVPYSPIDIGPPTILEEQRIMAIVADIVFYYELRHAIVFQDLLGPSEATRFSKLSEEDYLYFKSMDQYWSMKVILDWMRKHAGDEGIWEWIGHSIEGPLCCPSLTPLTEFDLDAARYGRAPGLALYRSCWRHYSLLHRIGMDIFAELGLFFWDRERLAALGFLLKEKRNDKWFTGNIEDATVHVASLLNEEQWNTLYQEQKRQRQARSRG